MEARAKLSYARIAPRKVSIVLDLIRKMCIRDRKPGMVLYEKYETAYVTPDPQVLEKLGAGG